MSEKREVKVRRAEPEDGEVFISLVVGLADYENLPAPDEAAQQRLLQDAFGENKRFDLLLAEVDGQPAGYAVLFETYSTFLARPKLYLEDLFVAPDARGKGIGRALIEAVYAEADGHLVELLPPGSNGFVRGVLRGFARERRRNEVGQAPPFRLTRCSDGRLSLADATTGRTVELEAFGPTNLAAFAGLLPGAERTP